MKGERKAERGEGGGGRNEQARKSYWSASRRPYTLHQSSLLARGLTTSLRRDKRTSWPGNLGIPVGTVIVGEVDGKKAICWELRRD